MINRVLLLCVLLFPPVCAKAADYKVVITGQDGKSISFTVSEGDYNLSVRPSGIFIGWQDSPSPPPVDPVVTPDNPPTPNPQAPLSPSAKLRQAYNAAINTALKKVADAVEARQIVSKAAALQMFATELEAAKKAFSDAHALAGSNFLDQAGNIINAKAYADSWREFVK